MQTLSPTKARSNLTFWLKAAARGEDVGILYGEQIIALRPVSVESTDFAWREYGATSSDLRGQELIVDISAPVQTQLSVL